MGENYALNKYVFLRSYLHFTACLKFWVLLPGYNYQGCLCPKVVGYAFLYQVSVNLDFFAHYYLCIISISVFADQVAHTHVRFSIT